MWVKRSHLHCLKLLRTAEPRSRDFVLRIVFKWSNYLNYSMVAALVVLGFRCWNKHIQNCEQTSLCFSLSSVPGHSCVWLVRSEQPAGLHRLEAVLWCVAAERKIPQQGIPEDLQWQDCWYKLSQGYLEIYKYVLHLYCRKWLKFNYKWIQVECRRGKKSHFTD